MNLTKRQAVIAEERLAEALGRPIKRCPACNEIGSHFVPEGLDDDDTVIPGRFTCEPDPEPDPTAVGFDFDDIEPWEGHPNTPVSAVELARLIAEDERLS